MAANSTSIKPGETRNPGGMTKEARAERERATALLVNPVHDAKWVESYIGALEDKVPAIILDYTHRKLGKPPETINVSDETAERLLSLTPAARLAYIDALAKEPK